MYKVIVPVRARRIEEIVEVCEEDVLEVYTSDVAIEDLSDAAVEKITQKGENDN